MSFNTTDMGESLFSGAEAAAESANYRLRRLYEADLASSAPVTGVPVEIPRASGKPGVAIEFKARRAGSQQWVSGVIVRDDETGKVAVWERLFAHTSKGVAIPKFKPFDVGFLPGAWGRPIEGRSTFETVAAAASLLERRWTTSQIAEACRDRVHPYVVVAVEWLDHEADDWMRNHPAFSPAWLERA